MATNAGGQRTARNQNECNQPQTWSLIAGSMIFVSGGMSLAYGLGWNQPTNLPNTPHLKFSWFIGVCVGAIVAAPLIHLMSKRIFMRLSTLLMFTGGVIFTSIPSNYVGIIAARYLNGIAIGLATVSFVVHASEIAYRTHRGTCLAVEQYGITVGISLQIIDASQWPDNLYFNFELNQLHGILIIIYASIAFAATFAITESPIFCIRRSDEAAALECLRRLRKPRVVTPETRAWLEELNAYVSQNEYEHWVASIADSLGPLVKMSLYRSLVALSFSLPLNEVLLVSATVSLGYANNWIPIVYAVLRFVGGFIGMFLLDSIGRKCFSLLSLLVMAALAIGIGGIFMDAQHLLDQNQMTAVCTLLMIMQIFAGLFVPSASTYLGEAFPLLVKPYFIAVCVVLENVIHIVIICSFTFSTWHVFIYGVVVGVIMLCCFIFFYLSIPETRNTTLSEAQDRFSRFVNPKLI